MNIVQNNMYPIFEADQVLTSDHLNDLFNYLEEQERLTRAKLVGAGIVCGLDVKLEGSGATTTVVISKGVGLTSKGYMAVLEGEEGAETVSYPYFTNYVDPNEEVYSFFDGGATQIPLYELQSQKVIGAESLNNLGLPITDFGVLLYLECYDKKLKNCIENDCNEKGVERIFTLRKLLVRKSHLRTIICQEEELNVPKSESEIDDYTNARYKLQHIHVERFKTAGVPIISSSQLIKKYQDLIIDAAENVFGKLKTQLPFLDPIINKEYDIKAALDSILNNLPADFGPGVRNLSVCDLQYDYDYFCDVAAAYNELAEAAFDMISECCPALDRFPKHLRLGELSSADTCPPSAYRHTFTHSPIHNDQYKQRDLVVALARKLVAILNSFQTVEAFQTLRITPSAALAKPLSQKAIPYYYDIDDSLLRNWNHQLKRRCLENENLSYHASNYATADHIVSPLNYGLEKHDFFRIEGHICKDYRVAMREIIAERDSQNLPFDVIALKVSRDPLDTDFDKLSCNFRDMEILCEAWKSELLCLMRKVLAGISQAPVSQAIITEEAAAASTKAIVTGGTGVTSAERVLSTEGTVATKFAQPGDVFEGAVDSIGSVEDTIGAFYNVAVQQENEVCKYDTNVSQAILEVDGVSTLPIEDVYVAYTYPVELMTALLEFARIIDVDCADINIDVLRNSIQNLNLKARQYQTGLRSYQARPVQNVQIDYETMSQLNLLVLTNCSFDSLVDIRREMDRRKEEIMRMNLFHEYVKKNPGIDHKAGVPKGGTFILVYSGDESVTVVKDDSSTASDAATAAAGAATSRTVRAAAPESGSATARAAAATGGKQFLVTGSVKDEDGEPLIGATISIPSLAIGSITDIDGNFRITNIPSGQHTLIFQYVGLQEERVIVTGNTTSLQVVLSPVDPDAVASGTVIADFFVPYLCCSDCPPVSFIIAETPAEEPADPVGLALANDNFCVPDDKTYAFVVTPTDGVVTGNGVTGTVASGFSFAPNQVDFGTDVITTVNNFQVNGEDVPLSKTVQKMPSLDFDAEISWKIDKDGMAKPFLSLGIAEYDDRFEYKWRVIANRDAAKIELFDEAHPSGSSNRVFILDGEKEGTLITIELKSDNGSCSDENNAELNIPKPDIISEVIFELRFGDTPVLKPPYSFANTLGLPIEVLASPLGTFDNTSSLKVLGFSLPQETSDNKTRYTFSAEGKPQGSYLLQYNVDGVLTPLQITITGTIKAAEFSGLDVSSGLKSDEKMTEVLGAGSLAIENTSGVANALMGRLENAKMATALSKGEFNEPFVEGIEPATTDVTNKLIASKDASKVNNTAAQNTMLDLYRTQLVMTLEMIVAQEEDLSTQNPLSKLLTKLKKDLVKMKKAGLKINAGNKTRVAIQSNIKKMADKPKAAKRAKDLLAAVTA